MKIDDYLWFAATYMLQLDVVYDWVLYIIFYIYYIYYIYILAILHVLFLGKHLKEKHMSETTNTMG
jgi:hypothetical protein